jgi:hypothetical protein
MGCSATEKGRRVMARMLWLSKRHESVRTWMADSEATQGSQGADFTGPGRPATGSVSPVHASSAALGMFEIPLSFAAYRRPRPPGMAGVTP